MDIYRELRQEHDRMRELLASLARSTRMTGAFRARDLSLLHDSLTSHAELESEHFYPVLLRNGDAGGAAERALEEHATASRLLEDLAATGVERPEWGAKLQTLRETLEAHMRDEEETVFALVKELLEVDQVRAVDEAMEAEREDAQAAAPRRPRGKKVRYAVVGLGHIAQVAVLPAFANARRNSRLVALVSDDAKKLARLGKKYDVGLRRSYDEYDALLRSGEIDAVYIALPNDMHRDFTLRAAEAGVHVLCEKPLATSVKDCEQMIRVAQANGVKLMTAYRLHFERANLKAIATVQNGRIGEPRYFHSMFSKQVRDEENIRLDQGRGGGPLFDLGVYCINAVRNLFRDEPIEVTALQGQGHDERFDEVPESTSAQVRFPGGRLASFTCSFGAADVSMFRIVGTKGSLELDPAYEYSEGLEEHLTVGKRQRTKLHPKRDQFAPELLHFSECILEDEEPEPSGVEGLADLRVVEALLESARSGRSVRLGQFDPGQRPSLAQEMRRPAVKKPDEIHAQAPGDD
jgi:glucose-fructose oxidoreductase